MQKKFADKIVALEGRVHDKMGFILKEKFELENKIKSGLMAKDKVYQDYYSTVQAKERQDSDYSLRL